MFDRLITSPVIPTGHGIVQFLLENILFNPSLRTCVQRLKLAVTKLTTAYVQRLQQKCSDMVSLSLVPRLRPCTSLGTRLGVPEKLIQERTGHRSLEALRSYERLDEVQHKAVSTLLSNTPEKSHSMTCNQRLLSTKTNSFSMPSTSYGPPLQTVTLQHLHGCTINFNCAPPPALATPQLALQDTTYTETELSEHFNT